MIKINISDKAAKKFADLEDEWGGGPLAMNPNSPQNKKPKEETQESEEIDYSWDLSTENKK